MTSVVDPALDTARTLRRQRGHPINANMTGSRSRQFMPVDLRAAVRLATTVRDQMRRRSGPSETAHRLLVQERMLAQADVLHGPGVR